MEIVELASYLPMAVVVAIFLDVVFTNATLEIAKLIEDYIEKKARKDISFFNHKKIFLSFFWCLVLSVVLAVSGFITWKETIFYGLVILGGGTFFYETILKHYQKSDDKENES